MHFVGGEFEAHVLVVIQDAHLAGQDQSVGYGGRFIVTAVRGHFADVDDVRQIVERSVDETQRVRERGHRLEDEVCFEICQADGVAATV